MSISRSFLAASAAVALLGLLAGTAAASPETFAEAKALAAKENKPLLVDFYTEW
jgi:hypothetical protein